MAVRSVDFRKGHDGLAAVASHEFGIDIHSGVIVVFRSKGGDRIKMLLFDGTGLVMTYKRLERGRFVWPGVGDGVMHLSRVQFETLFEGLDWRRVAVSEVTRPLRRRSEVFLRTSARPPGGNVQR